MDFELTLPGVIAKRASTDPNRVWAHEAKDGRSLTYGDAHTDALRWAAGLQSLGVEAGDNVIVMLSPSLDVIRVWLGLSWAGAVYTPINTDFEGRTLAHVLTASKARVVVTAKEYLGQLARVPEAFESIDRVVVVDGDGSEELSVPTIGRADLEAICDEASRRTPTEPLSPPNPWDISCLPFTSGTTGPSKGVLVPWVHLYYQCVRVTPLELLTPDDAFYCPFPTYHLGGLNAIYLMALAGGQVVLKERFSGTDFWDDVKRFGCTVMFLAAGMAYFVYRQPPRDDDADNPLRRVVMFPVIPEYEDFQKRFGIESLCTGFSMTELSAPIWADEVVDYQSCGRLKPGPPGYQIRLVDDNDNEVPVGEPGELIVRTDEPWAITSGYFENPTGTAHAFRNAWFHTGDVFRRDEGGNYYFLDRRKDAIRRRGELISSFEAEVHLVEHPAVAEAAVVGVPSEWGEEEVKAVVVLAPDATLTPEELIEFLVPRMPRFMLPRYIEFIDALPKTETQKVRKHLLREPAVGDGTWDRETTPLASRRREPTVTS